MSVVIRSVLWCRPSGSLSLVVPLFPDTLDCVQAVQECMAQPECEKLYRQLDYCVDEEAVAPLGPEARQACAEAQNALLHHRPLQECKCQRKSRKEALCLRVYWTVRFPQGEEPMHMYVSECVGVCMCICMNASLGMCVHEWKSCVGEYLGLGDMMRSYSTTNGVRKYMAFGRKVMLEAPRSSYKFPSVPFSITDVISAPTTYHLPISTLLFHNSYPSVQYLVGCLADWRKAEVTHRSSPSSLSSPYFLHIAFANVALD